MKRVIKLFVNILAVLMLTTCCFSLTACKEDIKTVEVTVEAYDSTNKRVSEYTLTVDLYRHLAPKTVDTILGYIEDGYYDNTVFYTNTDSGYQNMYFVGDIVAEGDSFRQNEIKPEIYGEFEANGTIGSDLLNEKGSIGLWRSWYEADTSTGDYKNSSNARNSGRATWFVPAASKLSYNDYFCVFAKIDLLDEENAKVYSALSTVFANTTYYESYEIYYTGEYDVSSADRNYGLTFNLMKKETFDEQNGAGKITGIFEAEDEQLICYNKAEIRLPKFTNGNCNAKIVSVKVK